MSRLFDSIFVRLVVSVFVAEFVIMWGCGYSETITTFVSEHLVLGALLDAIVLMVVVTPLFFWLIKKSMDPLIEVASAWSFGELSRRVNVERRGEFGALARVFNEMAERLQGDAMDMERQVLERTEKLNRTQRATLNILEDLQASNVALEKSRLSFINIVEKSVDGVLVVCCDGVVRFVSPSAACMFGTEVGKMVGTTFDVPVRGGQASEVSIIRTNGEAGVGELRAGPTEWDGRGAQLVHVHDITNRKKAETAIAESEAFFRAIFDTATDGILIADLENKNFNMGNRAICQQLGYSHEEIRKMSVKDIHPEEDLPYVVDQFERQGKGEFTLAKNIPLKRKNGTVFFADVNSSVVTRAGKKFLLGLFHDISERKKMEEELIIANANLRRMDKLKDEFVSIVSHELRTPLAVISESVGIVQDEVTGKINLEQAELLNMCRGNIERLTNIINDLLDISKIEAGKIEIRKAVVNMADLVRGVCDTWNASIATKNQSCTVIVPERAVEVRVDSEKITQVLNNLISNALKYAQDGQVAVELRDRESAVDVSVSNTGVGIDREDLPLVFGKFRQFKRTVGAGPHGTGLGLAICKNLVELHKGTIRVESEPGKVTRFTFTLPIPGED